MKKDATYSMRPALGRKAPVSGLLISTAGSLLITLIIEALFRRSVVDVFMFIAGNPLAFMLDWLVVAFTFCAALAFRKKLFTMTLACVFWLGIGIANWLVMTHRTANPLSSADLQLNMAAILIAPVYYEWWEMMLGGILAVGLITGLVFLAVKAPRYRRETKPALWRLGVCAVLLAACLMTCVGKGYVTTSLRPSLYDAYTRNGFAYSFVYSFFDNGIRKPGEYSDEIVREIGDDIDINVETQEEAPEDGQPVDEGESAGMLEHFRQFIASVSLSETPEGYTAEAVDTIRGLIAGGSTVDGQELPNVIFVQLESFFDPTKLTSYEFDTDPIPNFRALTQTCSAGKLYVPVVAGGTANTEFEVLTGCDLDFFGAGEFPYYSVLKENVFESLATDLKARGFTATLLHDFTGSFYSRNVVYSNLCFDRFVSLEYMDGYDLTEHSWARDEILGKYISDSLTTTPGRDFLYAITVQTHGSYAAGKDFEPTVRVTKAPGDRQKSEMEFYLAQMHEVDAFIGELTEMLAEYPEDVMLVLYCDHLPGIEFDVEDLSDGELYATPYVIWTNFDMEKQDADVEAYQLGAYAMSRVNMDGGVMIRFHQSQHDKGDYLDNLLILQYDLMYGQRYAYGGRVLERSDEMTFGLAEITADSACCRDGSLFVYGRGFTPSSRIFIDGNRQDTIFVNSGILVVPDTELDGDETVSVGQVCADLTVLSETQVKEIK